MNLPQGAIDFLVYLAPSLLVFGTSYFLVKRFLDNEQKMKYAELKRTMDNNLLPLRLQAYERIILFLERISPNNLLSRVYEPGMNVLVFHKELLLTIKTEYEHNITQQVYITNAGWAIVRTSRDELIKLINLSLGKCNPLSPGVELSKVIFETMMAQEEYPIQNAIDQIKNEVHSLF
ncbi:MAG: hypothetical protein IPP71_00380 [Bacteroidetes bacterium]|nr:hypothetical protein [Bacteroidota bacterium]